MAAALPWTNVVLGIKPGIAHGMANATATMTDATGKASANATKTYIKLQPTNIKATLQLITDILKAG